jgi:hypothetical protein
MNVYTYWEDIPGSTMPVYLQRCLETISKRCDHVHLTPDNIHEYVSDLHPRVDEFRVMAHKADYLRTCILEQNGGLWLDCDMIMTNEPTEALDALKDNDYVCALNYLGQPAISYIGSQKGGKVISQWRKDIEEYLDSGKTAFNWTQIGSDLVAKSLSNVRWHQLPTDLVLPIPFSRFNLFLEPGLDWLPSPNTLSIALYNSQMPKYIKEMDDIMATPILLSRLLRHYT